MRRRFCVRRGVGGVVRRLRLGRTSSQTRRRNERDERCRICSRALPLVASMRQEAKAKGDCNHTRRPFVGEEIRKHLSQSAALSTLQLLAAPDHPLCRHAYLGAGTCTRLWAGLQCIVRTPHGSLTERRGQSPRAARQRPAAAFPEELVLPPRTHSIPPSRPRTHTTHARRRPIRPVPLPLATRGRR